MMNEFESAMESKCRTPEMADAISITSEQDLHPAQINDGPLLSSNAAAPEGDFENLEGLDLVHDPKSIAIETLYTLQLFLDNLIGLCGRIMEEKTTASPEGLEASYERLLEGIGTVMESILTARSVLRIGLHQKINLLEADLLSILKDLLEATEENNIAYRDELIAVHLPQNLKEWRHEGIPEMISCRDS
jgi:hypothetical protein